MRVPTPFLLAAAVAVAPWSAAAVQVISPPPTTVGLALSGGSAKGIAHVGVIRALERLGVRVDVVAGTSMGSVVGGLYSMGLTVDSVESIIRNADWSALIGDGVSRSRRFLDQRRMDERAILSVPLEDLRVRLPTGAIVGSNVIRVLEVATWEAAGVRVFRDLPRPFVALATDLETGEPVALRGGVLSEALRASTGIPAVVEPLSLDGRLLVDGALSRNLPAADARELGADFVICSDVSDPLDSAEDLESLLDVFSQVTALSMLAANNEQRQLCDVLIRPDVDRISPLAFDAVGDWVMRGDTAVAPHEALLRALAARAPGPGGSLPRPADFLADSVRIRGIAVEGSVDERVTSLVRSELELEVGDYVNRSDMESRLGDLDATGLFRLVRYRLDRAVDGVILTVIVEERARDRLAVGLRYDDEWRAALLFTAMLHNALAYGSVARFDLRVGEETRIGATLTRRRGVTGRLGTGFAAHWSQGELDLPASLGGRTGVELSTARLWLGLAATRGTAIRLEMTGERAAYAADDTDLVLVSGSVVLDHETLDRIDFPRSGADIRGRIEWGSANVPVEARFTLATLDARYYVPLHARVTFDFGAWIGYERGEIPRHRRFFLGGAHPSAVFSTTHALFQGLPLQEHIGSAVQVARLGMRWQVSGATYLRSGVDIGAARDAWQFPMERPMTGWSLRAGTESLIGPVELELAKVWGHRYDPRLSVSVGRHF